MVFRKTKFSEVIEVQRSRYLDNRGSFEELFSSRVLKEFGLTQISQVNLSTSDIGVIRGMHWQKAPHAQGKLITCISGSVFDVAIDLRQSSHNFLKHVSLTLEAGLGNSVWIPEGFAHGFQSLEPGSKVLYLTTNNYDLMHSRGLRYDDHFLDIAWPLSVSEVSQQDLDLPTIPKLNSNDLF